MNLLFLIPLASVFTLTPSSLIVVAAIILTILALDVFFHSDYISQLGILGVSIYIALSFDISPEWQILWVIVMWLVISFIFYFGWRVLAKPLCDIITPKIKSCSDGCAGEVGTFRLISGKPLCYWNGDLWPVAFDKSLELNDGDEVFISGIVSGKMQIKKNKK
jgi:membrane protein implicated in regulation of membrane protease activity